MSKEEFKPGDIYVFTTKKGKPIYFLLIKEVDDYYYEVLRLDTGLIVERSRYELLSYYEKYLPREEE